MTTCVASAALLLATAGLAQAGDPDAPATDVAEAIAAVAPDAGEVVESSSAGGAFVSQTSEASVVVPRSTDDPVVLASTNPETPDLTVTLPDLAGADPARQADDGTLVYTSDDDASLAVQPLADGSTRFLSVLENDRAPERYDYTLDGFDLVLQEGGSVLVLNGDEPVGVVAVPWATDANGVSVPTRYEVAGSTLTQIVDHAAGDLAYPITADPWWNPFSWNWSKIGRATVSGLKKCGLGALGVSAGAVGANVLVNVVRNAAGKYLISIYGGPYGLIGVAAAGCVGNLIS